MPEKEVRQKKIKGQKRGESLRRLSADANKARLGTFSLHDSSTEKIEEHLKGRRRKIVFHHIVEEKG